ncbi:hypothetical protein [Psychrobacter sp. LV10R520-6]|uniref:hypothetical protein n=1 Tax=Psychrobacter sp. LV10R520-6 TaxID=1415574 RepID=UPI0024CA9FE7|nr:hypothetical protein [Psychrobacter sp. LV10R520-6]SNT69359.1 hypothetical protein SAMN04488491_0436 [Psychrobacter sp. LV10R520-6]
MKSYGSLKNVALLSFSVLIGMSAANAHTTNLDASVLNNCDAVTSFAKNADHNDAQISSNQMRSYVDARVACQIQHQDQHLQSEKYFVDKYGRDRDTNAEAILNEYVAH